MHRPACLIFLFFFATVLLCAFVCSTKGEKMAMLDDAVDGGMLLKSNLEAPGEEVVRARFQSLSNCHKISMF